MTNRVVCGTGLIGRGLVSSGYQFLQSQSNSLLSRSIGITRQQESSILEELNNLTPSFFVNAAGPSSVYESTRDFPSYVEFPWQQCKSQLEILNKLRKPPIYVFISSGSVYGDTSPFGCLETAALSPVSPYAEGKIKAEEILRSLSSIYRGGVIVLRCFSVYDYELKSRLPYIVSQNLQKKGIFTLAGTGHELRDYIHVSDLSPAIEIGSRDLDTYQVYNVGTGIGKSVEDLCILGAETYKLEYKVGKTVRFSGEVREYDPQNLVANISTLVNLGFKPKIPFEKGMRAYFEFRRFG